MSDREYDRFIDEIAGELRGPVRLDPAFDDRVMAEIAAPVVLELRPRAATPALRRRAVRIFGGLAAAAAVTTIAVLRFQPRPDTTPAATVAQNPADLQPAAPSDFRPVSTADLPLERRGSQRHTFTLEARDAKSVSLVGDFTEWDKGAIKLDEKHGVWTATIILPPGRHKYLFMVDGKWVADPNAEREPSNDFGERNSIVTIQGVVP